MRNKSSLKFDLTLTELIVWLDLCEVSLTLECNPLRECGKNTDQKNSEYGHFSRNERSRNCQWD